jgi:hypothetical protein
LNEVKCENEIMKETQENWNFKIKESRIPKKNEKKWIIWNYCKFLQRKNWSLHNRNAFCSSLFCVNNNSKVILDVLQIMHCMSMCYIPILCFLLTQK